jgi:hypothetical protein
MAARKINEMNPGGPKFLIEALEVMPRNSEDVFARNVAENFVRKTLTPMDIANHLRRWIEIYHKDRKWCAQFYGTSDKPMSATWVDGHLALLKLEPATQRKIHNREMGWQAGRELSNLPPEEQQLIVDIIGGSGERATVDNVVKRKRQLNRLDKPRRRPKKEVVEAFETIAGSPDCPPKVKKFLDTVVEFVDGKHEVDDLVNLAWRLA